MGKLVFVIGGSRSGKTSFALAGAARAAGSGRRVYIATAQALDGEMAERIEKHKAERGSAWDTLEEPVHLDRAIRSCGGARVVVVDCLTLWLSNLLCGGLDAAQAEEAFLGALAALDSGVQVYVVSNEVGMGIVPENETARQFRDMAGRLNQAIARLAEEVYMMVAGVPVKVK